MTDRFGDCHDPFCFGCLKCAKVMGEPVQAFQSKMISEVEEENKQLRDHLKIVMETLEDFEQFGVRADLTPTMGHIRDWFWWQDYLRRADEGVRRRARKALQQLEA